MRHKVDLEITITPDEIREMIADKVNHRRNGGGLLFRIKPEDVTVESDGSAVIRAERGCGDDTHWWSETHQVPPQERGP